MKTLYQKENAHVVFNFWGHCLIGDGGEIILNPVIRHRVKSWTKYTKKERKESIDRLIAEMTEVGISSKKFYEILQGLEKNSEERIVGMA